MIRFDVPALVGAALLSLPAPSFGQGHQLPTWDSSQWVPYSVHGGNQPVDGWWFLAVKPGDTHGESEVHVMTWHDAGTTIACDHKLLPESWIHFESAGFTCCNFSAYAAPPNEREQSSSEFASVRAWDAPYSGTVFITTPNGNVRKPDGSMDGDGSWIRIYRNDFKFFEQHLEEDDTAGFAINESIVVNAGDRLWFHNDPGLDSVDDGVIFLPVVTLSAGAGYDPSQVTRQSVADFASDHTQGANGWTYEAYERSTNSYSQMAVTGVDGFGRFWQEGTSTCKIWADRQHPSDTHDAVRVWTAPKDGFLMVRSLTPLQKLAAGDPVAVQLRHIHQGSVEIVWEGTVTDAKSIPFGAIANVRTGDRIALHVDAVAPSSTTSLVGVDLQLDLYPGGEIPRTPVDHGGPGDVTITSDDLWFYEDHEITGNLVLSSGELTVSDSTVSLLMSYENEHTYKFYDGDLVTRNSTIGGGTLTSDPLHTSFQFWHPGEGRWIVDDTTVEFSYGILLNDGADASVLEGREMKGGQHSDLIHMGPGAQVTLDDSLFRFRLQFPATSGDFHFDLPIDEPLTTVIDANDIPGVTWSLDLTDTEVPNWNLAPYGMTSGGVTKTITLDDVETIWAEISGTDLVGTATPFTGTLTTSPSGPDELSFLDTFNVRWEAGTSPTKIDLWAVYLNGDQTAVTLTPAGGPTNIAELFAFDGARVGYIGASGQHDAVCMATVIRCFDPGSQLFLMNCSLGTTWTKGSIRAENGAYIRIDAAHLVNDIALQAVGGSTIVVTNVDPASSGVFDCSADGTSQITIDGVSCP